MESQHIAAHIQQEFPVQIMWLGERSFSILMDDGVPVSQQDDLRKRINSRVAELAGEKNIVSPNLLDTLYEGRLSQAERQYRVQENARKRNAAKLRTRLCPPVGLVMTALAWLCFATENGIMGTLYAGIALIAIGLLVYGWLFDRPQEVK